MICNTFQRVLYTLGIDIIPDVWSNLLLTQGAVIFNAGYWGGRIFGGVLNFLTLLYWVIKYFC